MGWIDAELVLTSLAAMLSPTTLTFSVLTLVLGDRPLRTGLWFFLGALGATLGIGVVAAFVIGDIAASTALQPEDVGRRPRHRPRRVLLVWSSASSDGRANPKRTASDGRADGKGRLLAAVAVVGAGAALANPGAFIPIALKNISELDPSAAQYIVDWLFFTLVSLLPLALALVRSPRRPRWATRLLGGARGWLERHARIVAAVIVVLLAASLLRNGIAGLTG